MKRSTSKLAKSHAESRRLLAALKKTLPVTAIAAGIQMQPQSLYNVLREPHRGLSPAALDRLRRLAARHGVDGASVGTARSATPSSATRSTVTPTAASDAQPRPRGATVPVLGKRQLATFLAELDRLESEGVRRKTIALALGYSSPTSLSTAVRRGRIPADLLPKLAEVSPALRSSAVPPTATISAASAPPPEAATVPDLPPGSVLDVAIGGAPAFGASAQSPTAPEAPDTGSATTDERFAPALPLAAAVGQALARTVSEASSDHIAVELRMLFRNDAPRALVPYLEDTARQLRGARELLEEARASGATTLLTDPGVERVCLLLSHLEQQLSLS